MWIPLFFGQRLAAVLIESVLIASIKSFNSVIPLDSCCSYVQWVRFSQRFTFSVEMPRRPRGMHLSPLKIQRAAVRDHLNQTSIKTNVLGL